MGVRKYVQGKPVDPEYKGFTPIVVLTKSSKYGDLGPYVVTTDEGYIFENAYQQTKLYRTVPKTIQRYSRYDPTVIWEHPAEVHMDENDNPTEAYWHWRQKLCECPYPVRYPVGFHHRHKCVCALKEVKEENNTITYIELDYIESRKQIYLPEYVKCARKVGLYNKLKEMLESGMNLLIIEIDGPHQESLEYYKEKYGVVDDFIVNDTILVTKENMEIMLNDPKHPFGHGYCLAMALLDWV